jgi:hypothetical protein
MLAVSIQTLYRSLVEVLPGSSTEKTVFGRSEQCVSSDSVPSAKCECDWIVNPGPE